MLLMPVLNKLAALSLVAIVPSNVPSSHDTAATRTLASGAVESDPEVAA
jgi:hypothetical protein